MDKLDVTLSEIIAIDYLFCMKILFYTLKDNTVMEHNSTSYMYSIEVQ